MAKLGDKAGTRLSLDCNAPQATGHVLLHQGGGVVRLDQVGTSGIAPNAVTAEKITAVDMPFFGIGVHGNVTLDGSTTFAAPFGAPSSSTYTLSGDVSCRTLTINDGVTLKPNSYRITAQTIVLHGTAVIHIDGPSGTSGSGTSGGPNGNGYSAHTLGGSGTGGKGGNGGNSAAGGIGNAGTSEASTYGGDGGDSAAGGNGTGGLTNYSGGAAGAGGTGTAAVATIDTLATAMHLYDTVGVQITGGSGGAGGGGGGGNSTPNSGGGGGGGGAGGGVILIAATTIDVTDWTGRISANGGNGGNGASGTNTPPGAGGSGGGGGGGGGGLVVVLCRAITGATVPTSYSARSTSVQTLSVALGSGTIQVSGGNNGTGSSAGADGTHGAVLVLNMSQPYIPADELAGADAIVTDLDDMTDPAPDAFVSDQPNTFRRAN